MSRGNRSLPRRALVVAGGIAASAMLLIPNGRAHAAAQLGETFEPVICSADRTHLQTAPSYTAPFAGVITSWSYQANPNPGTNPRIKFKVGRATGNADEYTIVGESALQATQVGQFHTFPAQISVQAGDVIGIYVADQGGCGRTTTGVPHPEASVAGDQMPGNTATYVPAGFFQLDISAVLEPDCDSDGLGDETQDAQLTAPNCPQPQPEPQPEPQPTTKADGTLTIDANKGKVEKGRKVLLSGQLDVASNESCEQNRQIEIQRRLKSEDDSKFTTFESVSTDAAGNFTTREKVKKTYFYRAVVSETDACDDETSNSQKVRVQKKKAAQEA